VIGLHRSSESEQRLAAPDCERALQHVGDRQRVFVAMVGLTTDSQWWLRQLIARSAWVAIPLAASPS